MNKSASGIMIVACSAHAYERKAIQAEEDVSEYGFYPTAQFESFYQYTLIMYYVSQRMTERKCDTALSAQWKANSINELILMRV